MEELKMREEEVQYGVCSLGGGGTTQMQNTFSFCFKEGTGN